MRFEMIENFSVTFSSLKFSFCMAAIISAPTPFKRLCNFAPYFSWQKSGYGTTKNLIPTLVQGKNPMGYNPKIYSLTFSAEKAQWLQPKILSPQFLWQKTRCLSAWKTKNLQDVQISARGDYSQKESRQRIVISSACCSQHSRNRNRIVRSRFRLLCFCYGSNSGVGSYTSIISRDANRDPLVNGL